MKIQLSKDLVAQMGEWLEQAYPHEACGFMTGYIEDDVRVVDSLIKVENRSTENLRRRFVIDPLDYIKAERRTDAEEKLLLGVFHSHPDHPAIPSEHDLASAQPFFSYIIAAVDNGAMQQVRSYRLDDKAFKEETIIQQQ